MENNSQNPDIEIRTMKSDIAAIKASGGDATSLQFVKLAEDKKPAAVEEAKINISAPGYAGPEQAIFVSTGEVKAATGESAKTKSLLKTIIIIVITITAIAGLGYLTYNIILKVLK
jgi:hypothetical protein